MKAPIVVSAFALAFAAAPVLAMAPEGAVPRGGGSGGGHSGGGSSSGAAARQPSSGGGGSSSSGVSSGYDRSSSSRSATTDAQRRHPRPGTGTGRRGGVSYRPYPYYYYSPGYYGYYGGYYSDWWYGPGWYSWGYYPGYSYRYRGAYDDDGALRLQVSPNKARVYVDGYYAGVVDDFDGLFQRLNLPPGRHELSFKLEGYKTHRIRLYVPPDQTLKIRYDLVQGEGEDTVDDSLDKAGAEWADRERERSRDRDRDRSYRYSYRDRDKERERASDRERDDDGRDAERDDDDAPAATGSAVLSLEVQPEQAAVYVDGAFRGTGKDVDDLNLPPGRHRVEVVAPGFKTFDREVEVKSGDTEELTIELQRP